MPAVGTEFDVKARHREKFLGRSSVPGFGGPVQGSRCQGFAIRAEGNAGEGAGVPAQDADLLSGLGIAQYGGVVTAAYQQSPAIRAARNRVQRFTLHQEYNLPAADIPDVGAAIPTGGSQPGAIRAEIQAADRAGMAAEGPDGFSS
jgi:hypothetical protein